MAIKLNDSFLSSFVSDSELKGIAPIIKNAHARLNEKSGLGSEFLGWTTLPTDYDTDEFSRIKAAAKKIRSDSKALVVIGIGGSYLGARSAIELLQGQSRNELDGLKIYYAGNNLDPHYINEIIGLIGDDDFSVNIISKSGTTTEPAIAFRIFKELLIRKYGSAEANKRIYATTDAKVGTLHDQAVREGWESFVVPDNVGGRYSVLTAVGLLPIAAAGIDIAKVMAGAVVAQTELMEPCVRKNACLKYAALRNILYNKGKAIELLVSYNPSLTQFSEWFKQLFGESEGKDGKGIFPASVVYSTDLHSMGQYVQDGRRHLFETVIRIGKPKSDIALTVDDENIDGLNFLAGKQLSEVCDTALTATAIAHTEGGAPNIILEIPELNEFEYGYAVYFFEKACGVSAYALGVNPFDQPGVEAYKTKMFELLGKPGYTKSI